MGPIIEGHAQVIIELRRRARYHHLVGTITAASAAIVLLAATVLAVLWIIDPLFNILDTDNSRVLLASSIRVFALAMVGYLIRLFTSIYRYNTQLWNHYITRALALELAADGKVPLASAVAALSASAVTFGEDGPLLGNVSLSSDSH
jgi:ABC-type multidrug transport system fused ATPase/permease subunit